MITDSYTGQTFIGSRNAPDGIPHEMKTLPDRFRLNGARKFKGEFLASLSPEQIALMYDAVPMAATDEVSS